MPLLDIRGEPQRALFLADYTSCRLEALTGQAINTIATTSNTMTDSEGDALAEVEIGVPLPHVEVVVFVLQICGGYVVEAFEVLGHVLLVGPSDESDSAPIPKDISLEVQRPAHHRQFERVVLLGFRRVLQVHGEMPPQKPMQ